jgi:hypothetical protein
MPTIVFETWAGAPLCRLDVAEDATLAQVHAQVLAAWPGKQPRIPLLSFTVLRDAEAPKHVCRIEELLQHGRVAVVPIPVNMWRRLLQAMAKYPGDLGAFPTRNPKYVRNDGDANIAAYRAVAACLGWDYDTRIWMSCGPVVELLHRLVGKGKFRHILGNVVPAALYLDAAHPDLAQHFYDAFRSKDKELEALAVGASFVEDCDDCRGEQSRCGYEQRVYVVAKVDRKQMEAAFAVCAEAHFPTDADIPVDLWVEDLFGPQPAAEVAAARAQKRKRQQ